MVDNYIWFNPVNSVLFCNLNCLFRKHNLFQINPQPLRFAFSSTNFSFQDGIWLLELGARLCVPTSRSAEGSWTHFFLQRFSYYCGLHSNFPSTLGFLRRWQVLERWDPGLSSCLDQSPLVLPWLASSTVIHPRLCCGSTFFSSLGSTSVACNPHPLLLIQLPARSAITCKFHSRPCGDVCFPSEK